VDSSKQRSNVADGERGCQKHHNACTNDPGKEAGTTAVVGGLGLKRFVKGGTLDKTFFWVTQGVAIPRLPILHSPRPQSSALICQARCLGTGKRLRPLRSDP